MMTIETTVKLHDTDAAGLLFFGHQFRMAHDAYEHFLNTSGHSFAWILRESDFFLPIVHAEADYKAPLFAGDRLTIRVRTESIGRTSFVLGYEFLNEQADTVGTAQTVHVCIDKKDRQKRSLPESLRTALEKNR